MFSKFLDSEVIAVKSHRQPSAPVEQNFWHDRFEESPGDFDLDKLMKDAGWKITGNIPGGTSADLFTIEKGDLKRVLKIFYSPWYDNNDLDDTILGSWLGLDNPEEQPKGLAVIADPDKAASIKAMALVLPEQYMMRLREGVKQGKKPEERFRTEWLNSALFELGLVSYEADVLKALEASQPDRNSTVHVYDQFWIGYKSNQFPAQVIDYLYDSDNDIPSEAAEVALIETFDFVQQVRDLELDANDVEVTWSRTRLDEPEHIIFYDVDRMVAIPGVSCDELESEFSTIEGVLRKYERHFVEQQLVAWHGSDAEKDEAAECIRDIL